MIKAVIFDLDDTLYPEREYVISGFEVIGKYFNEKYNIKDTAEELIKLFDIDNNNVYGRYLYSINKENDKELFNIMIKLFRNHKPDKLNFYSDIEPMITKLKKRKIKIGIITDGRINGQENKIEALGIPKIFDYYIVTQSLGGEIYHKPCPKAYEIMAEKMNIKYNEMIFVGDNPIKDFAISSIYPIITVEIERENKIHKDKEYYKGIKPKYKIKNMNELIEIIEAEID